MCVCVCVCVCHRCGKDLKKLFSMPIIQHFINSKPMSEVYSDKHIYQPGTLRKVREHFWPYNITLIACYAIRESPA